MSKYYLAYGSNLNIEQMKWRCPSATVTGTGILENYKLRFKGSKTGSYLTIEPAAGKRVPVAVWRVTDSDESALDRYEGFPTFYYKKEMKLNCNGRQLTAFVYIMHGDRPVGIPSDSYLTVCMQGYKTFGFDYRYLREAYMEACDETGNG